MYIYLLHLPNKSTIHVGKYYGDVGNAPYMDPMGFTVAPSTLEIGEEGFLFVGERDPPC